MTDVRREAIQERPDDHPNVLPQAQSTPAVLREALVELKNLRGKLQAAEAVRSEPIAVVGMGCRFPGGADSPAAFWRLLREGRDGVIETPPERWDVDAYYDQDPEAPGKTYARAGGFLDRVDTFDASFFRISPREAESMDPQQRLLLEVAWEALENACQAPDRLAGSAAGVFLGIMLSDYASLLRRNGPAQIDAYHTSGNGLSFAAGRLAYFLGVHGPALVVDTACSSSLVAVHLACQALRRSECHLALAGGVNLILAPETGVAFAKAGILSPDGRCKTFDAAADGMGRGEGCGIVVLKRLSDALANRDHILAVLRESAVNQDGPGAGLTVPNGMAQEALLRQALAAARLKPAEVAYIEAHGTGTPLGDPIEIRAIGAAYCQGRPADRPLLIGSVKTNFGHMEGAAGIAGLMKTVLAVQHGEIPPHLRFHQPSPHIDWRDYPLVIPVTAVPWPAWAERRIAGVSAFGLSGTNVHVIVEQAPNTAAPAAVNRPPLHVLALSAKTAEGLEQLVAGYREWLAAGPAGDIADVCFSANTGRSHFPERLALVAASAEEIEARLEAVAAGQLPAQAFRGKAPAAAPKVAFLFTGAGSQYIGMGRELYETQPVFRAVLDRCSAWLAPCLARPLLDVIYAPEGHSADLDDQQYMPLAIFAVEMALAEMWKSWGVVPWTVMGHSLGEYAAACVAGVFSLEDGLHLLVERARLMRQLAGDGEMASVFTGEARVVEAMRGFEAEVALAAVNGPDNFTISGRRGAVAAVCAALEAKGTKTNRLNVSQAIHSPLMEPVLAPFEAVVRHARLAAPQIPVVSNVTGGPVAAELAEAEYWCRHLRRPVRFAEGMATLDRLGYGIFVEIGPKPALLATGRRCLEGDGRAWLPSLRPGRGDWAQMLGSLAELYVRGVAVDWAGCEPADACRRVALPTYPFQRQRYWFQRVEQPAQPVIYRATPPESRSNGGAASGAALAPHRPPRPDLTTPYVAPASEVEQHVARIWEEVIGMAPVGLDDNFFELGGDSLLASLLVTRLRKMFGNDLPMSSLLLDAPTVRELAARLAGQRSQPLSAAEDEGPALPILVPAPEERHQPFPLTDIQQAYVVGRDEQFDLGGVACHSYTEHEGTLVDLDRLNAAWQRLIERHDMLRAVVLPDGRQRVLEQVPLYQIEVLDLRGRSPAEVAVELAAIRERMSHQVHDPQRWPMFELRATRLDGDRCRLHLSMDAMITDGYSFRILAKELGQLYQEPETNLEPLPLSFRDYVLASQALGDTEAFRRSLSYWQERVKTLPSAPELPLTADRPAMTRPRFTRRRGKLAPEHWDELKRRAKHANLTPSGAVLAAYAEVVGTWSKTQHYTLNVPEFNRLPLHPQVNQITGEFASFTLVEIDHTRPESFAERGQAIQRQLWQAMNYRYVSGVRVLRELGRWRGGAAAAGAMPVVFTSMLVLDSLDAGTSPWAMLGDEVFGITQTPQVWLDMQVYEQDGALIFNWDAVEALFPPGMLDDMFDACCRLLECLACDETAWTAPSRDLLPATQVAQRLALCDNVVPIPERLAQDFFIEQAAKRPDQVAVVTPDRRLTYDEVYRRAVRVGQRLRELGARPNTLIAVVMDKGWEQVVATLGAVMAGAAYLPIDPDVPAERLAYLLVDSEVRWILTQSWLAGKLAWPEGTERLAVDDEGAWPVSDLALPAAQGPDDLACVIYTSGSTGLPKGAMIAHRGLVNALVQTSAHFRVGPADRALSLTALHHDMSVYDIFGVLGAGGTLVIPDAARRLDPDHWAELMRREQVTVWNSVPTMMQMLVEHAAGRADVLPQSLRLAFLGGDWIPVNLPKRLQALVPGAQLVSVGGPTETTLWNIWYPVEAVDPTWKSIPYGRPIANTRYYVLNQALEDCPTWVPGELCCAGVGVAQGYWRNEEQTQARFITHPRTGERIYRTGDLGRFLPDGTLEFMGRVDLQIKISGMRIEPGEIEAALCQNPAVQAAVVTAVEDSGGHKRLVAHVVPADASRPATEEVDDLLGSAEQRAAEGIVTDPVARLEFKLKHLNLRHEVADRPVVPLPAPPLDDALLDRWVARRSYRKFVAETISLEQFGHFLSCLRGLDLPGLPFPKYQYGSGGGLYPVQAYLYVKPGRIEGLAGGAYYYHPSQHRLVQLSTSDGFDRRVHAFTNRAIFDESAFAIFLVGQMAAMTPLYGEQNTRHFCVIEAGLMAQLLEMAAPAQGIGLCQIGSLHFEQVAPLFALDASHLYLHCLMGGPVHQGGDQRQALIEDWSAYRATTLDQELAAPAALEDEFRRYLEGKLPRHMVPAEFRLLEALPLTPNGKVDRKALSAPIARPVQPAAEFVAPQTELERMIAGIWQEVLETNQVGVYDNFFDLGGNSLRMVLVHTRLSQALGRDISVMTMFEHPTISAMARHLSQGQDKGPSFEPILDRVEKRKAALQAQRQRRSGHAA